MLSSATRCGTLPLRAREHAAVIVIIEGTEPIMPIRMAADATVAMSEAFGQSVDWKNWDR
jgi:hypothetical protein